MSPTTRRTHPPLPALVLLLALVTAVVVGVRPPPAGATPHYEAIRQALAAGAPIGCPDVRWAAQEGLLAPVEVRALADDGISCPDTAYLGLLTQAVRGDLGCVDLEWHAARGYLNRWQAASIEARLPACQLSTYAFLVTVQASGALTCADVTWHEQQGTISAVDAATLRAALERQGAGCAVPLGPGDEGDDVQALQDELEALGYWVGPEDGRYGLLTRQAMYAFEKATGRPVDGIADVADQAAMDGATRLRPSVPDAGADHVEVDKARQLLIIVRGGQVLWVFNTSTGTEEQYLHPEQGVQLADTPPGRHVVTWQVDGTSEGELGPLYRPKFFHHDGIAVHGFGSVPPLPVSHGCVRVTFEAMDLIWADDLMPLGTPVIVYGTTPGS